LYLREGCGTKRVIVNGLFGQLFIIPETLKQGSVPSGKPTKEKGKKKRNKKRK
jgi:hypothetical protein